MICKKCPRYWPFVRGIHRSPVNSPYKGQWRGALVFSLICARINDWVNNREAGDLRRHRAHYDVTVMWHIKGRKAMTWPNDISVYLQHIASLYYIELPEFTMKTSWHGDWFRITSPLLFVICLSRCWFDINGILRNTFKWNLIQYDFFNSTKRTWKYHLQNVGHIVLTSAG